MQGSAEAELPFPPFAQLFGFFDEPFAGALIGWSMANRDRFEASTVTGEQQVNPAIRSSLKFSDLGSVRGELEARLRPRAGELFHAAGLKCPESFALELELVAHGDGAHFKAHRDIAVGSGRGSEGLNDRLLSGVYYFHRQPKAFSGGELRIYRMGSVEAPGEYKDLEPVHNSLVVFPPWAAHEVRPVACASGAFEDSRFAVNCWFCRAQS